MVPLLLEEFHGEIPSIRDLRDTGRYCVAVLSADPVGQRGVLSSAHMLTIAAVAALLLPDGANMNSS